MTDEIPDTYTILDQALRRLEESEAPFYDGVRLAKQAAGDLRQLLANRTQYMNAKRALKMMAAQECNSTSCVGSQYGDCNDAILAGEQRIRCCPCYARYVLNGGTP